MGKLALYISCALMAGFFSAAAQLVHSQENQVNKVLPYIVQINSGRGPMGCGVIIDGAKGIIISPHTHGFDQDYWVTLNGGARITAQQVAFQPETEISFFKIDYPKVLPQAVLGDSDNLMIGETVVAVGAGGKSVSVGVISATNRKFRTSGGGAVSLIQTDARMSPDNAGGPLININGEMVGVNTYGSTRYEANTRGIGFAIAVNQIKMPPPQPAKTTSAPSGRPETNQAPPPAQARPPVKPAEKLYPYLGLQVTAVTEQNAAAQGIDHFWGVIIESLDPGGPAAQAGLFPGDIIVSLNDSPVLSVADFDESLKKMVVGGTTWIEYLRRGKSEMVQITVAGRPENEKRP